jgi:uncharacterized protein (DUF697 family)
MARSDTANTIVNTYTGLATAAAVIPIPVADTIAISGLQIAMVIQLGNLYDQPIGKEFAKGLLGVYAAAKVGEWIASLFKGIPGIGTIGGGIAQMTIAGTVTYSLGLALISILERGEKITVKNLKDEKDKQDPEEIERKKRELRFKATKTKEWEPKIAFQATPNPFLKEITFSFNVENFKLIKLLIIGDEYKEILSFTVASSQKNYNWNPTNIKSGSYIASLTCDDLLPIAITIEKR